MTSAPSATTWGSPAAAKHALLIHGLTSSSHAWHHVASSLAAQGYFVTAPNLVGHGLRVSTEYSIRANAEDLLPYLKARNYSLIIGHSVGALVALALFPYLPTSYPVAIILVDPPIKPSPEKIAFIHAKSIELIVNPKPGEVYCAENPLWKREDGIARELGTRLCYVDTVRYVFEHNPSWDFVDLLKTPESTRWKMTVLIADPAISDTCTLEHFQFHPHIRQVIVPGSGHWIQHDAPDSVIEEALKAVAELEVA